MDERGSAEGKTGEAKASWEFHVSRGQQQSSHTPRSRAQQRPRSAHSPTKRRRRVIRATHTATRDTSGPRCQAPGGGIVVTAAVIAALRAALREEIAAEVAAEVKRQLAGAAVVPAPAMTTAPEREWVDEIALAAWLGISRETVQQWRAHDDGPAYTRVAKRAVRYHVPTVRTWLAGRTR